MKKKLGVYIHIPFCASKCAYCDFYSLAGRERLMPDYKDALCRHINESGRQMEGYAIDTVYFGGGTPSYFGDKLLCDVLDVLKAQGRLRKDAEITFEANPDSLVQLDLQKMRKCGFNRISIGVQSADDAVLKMLGRRHDFAQARKAVQLARQNGFENISIDLMYGLPNQSGDGWAATLAMALELQPSHISCYELKLEKNTPMYVFKDSPFIPDDDTTADMYLYAVELLRRNGLFQYEISNFAKRGCESRHNMKYWLRGEYIGFGAAAHSFIGGMRYSIVPDAEQYIRNIRLGSGVIDTKEEISVFEQASEYLMLGLRTVRGVCESEYRSIYNSSFGMMNELFELYREHGWAELRDGRWSFTPEGFLLSNRLIGGILEAHTRQKAAAAGLVKNAEISDDQLTFFRNRDDIASIFQGM